MYIIEQRIFKGFFILVDLISRVYEPLLFAKSYHYKMTQTPKFYETVRLKRKSSSGIYLNSNLLLLI